MPNKYTAKEAWELSQKSRNERPGKYVHQLLQEEFDKDIEYLYMNIEGACKKGYDRILVPISLPLYTSVECNLFRTSIVKEFESSGYCIEIKITKEAMGLIAEVAVNITWKE